MPPRYVTLHLSLVTVHRQ